VAWKTNVIQHGDDVTLLTAPANYKRHIRDSETQ